MILQTRNTLLKPSNTEYKVMQYTGCNFFLIVDRITNNTKCCKHVLLLNCQSANLYKVGSLSLSNIMVHVLYVITILPSYVACWAQHFKLELESAILTSGHPVRCVSPRYHGSAIHSLAPWSSSGANQERGWYLKARSTPLHTELTEQKKGKKLRWERGLGDWENDELENKLERENQLDKN